MAQRTLVIILSEDIQKGFYGLQEGEVAQKALPPFTNLESISAFFLSNTYLAHLPKEGNFFPRKLFSL